MDFTLGSGYATHTPADGVTRRLHQSDQPVPTEQTAQDWNGILWSLMEVQAAGGQAAVPFNKDTPGSYKALLLALYELFIPVGCERVSHVPAAAWNPNSKFPGTTWVQAPAKTVAAQLDASVIDPDSWGTLGAVIGSVSTQLVPDNLPEHDHDFLPDGGEVLLRRSDGSGSISGVYTGSDLALAPASAVQAFGAASPDAVSLVQPTQVTIRWIRTA